MEAKILKWGNSAGIRIPHNVLKSLNVDVNDVLDLKQENDKIIISVPQKRKISLRERFNNYHGENLAKEFSWDENVGKEIW